MDQVEVLEHVEPVHDRLEDLALHPEHIGVAIALMHLMRLVGEISEEIDDQRRGENVGTIHSANTSRHQPNTDSQKAME